MLPSIDEAIKELEIAEKLNPRPWVKHSMNVGLAARNIAEKYPTWIRQKPILWVLCMISGEESALLIFRHMSMKVTNIAWEKDGMRLPEYV
jgi:hypothetical protein